MIIVFFRTLILYCLVVIVMRIMGKPQIGQLQPFELVITIMISELAAIPMSDTDIPLINGIIPIVTLLMAQVTLAYWSLKSEKARAVIGGRPSILIEKGKILEKELSRVRMNLNDLLEQLRGKDYPNIAEVDYAILESNGKLSVIPKGNSRPVTTKDLGILVPDPGLPLSLVIDGEIITHNLDKAGLSRKRLLETVNKQGVEKLEDLFFASVDSTGTLLWQLKEDGRK